MTVNRVTTPTACGRRRVRGRRRFGAAIAVVAVVLGACSGSPGEEPGADSDEPEATATTSVDDAAEPARSTEPAAEPAADDAAAPDSTVAENRDPPPVTDGPSPSGDQGGQTLGPLGETEAEFETEDGTVQIGGGEVPNEANRLPLPDDFVVQLSSETPTALGLTGTTSLTFADVLALYDAELASSGFEVTNREVTGEVFAVFDFESADEEGNVLIATTPGSSDITITLALADR